MELSSGIICAEELWTEGASEQTLAEAGKGADAGLQQESPVSSSFRELVQVSLTFWQMLKCFLVKVDAFLPRWLRCLQGIQQRDSPEALMTAPSDLETCRNRLVSKVLSCKNQPAKLDLMAMAQQLQEAQVGLTTRSCFANKREHGCVVFIFRSVEMLHSHGSPGSLRPEVLMLTAVMLWIFWRTSGVLLLRMQLPSSSKKRRSYRWWRTTFSRPRQPRPPWRD